MLKQKRLLKAKNKERSTSGTKIEMLRTMMKWKTILIDQTLKRDKQRPRKTFKNSSKKIKSTSKGSSRH